MIFVQIFRFSAGIMLGLSFNFQPAEEKICRIVPPV
jgi:hypothetical protein